MSAAAVSRSFEDARREHGAISSGLAELQQLVSPLESSSPDRRRLQIAVDEFLAEWGPRLVEHLEAESQLVAPRVGGSLPDETGVLDTFCHESEHFSALLQLLDEAREWLKAGEPGAEAGIAAAVSDLSSLWGQHLRRVDVIAPLLRRLEGPERA